MATALRITDGHITACTDSRKKEGRGACHAIHAMRVDGYGSCWHDVGWCLFCVWFGCVDRMAIAFSYVTDRAIVLGDLDGTTTRPFTPFDSEDEASYAPWIEDLRGKTTIEHPLLPLVYDGAWRGGGDPKPAEQGEEILSGREGAASGGEQCAGNVGSCAASGPRRFKRKKVKS